MKEETAIGTKATTRSSAAPLIGRAAELEALREALAGSISGKGRLVTVVGEAGMGKTHLVAAFAEVAESRGCHVLWSQLPEHPAAPPNFSWKLALRSCIQQADRETLLADLGSGAVDVAAIVPELCEMLSLEPAAPSPDSATDLYQLNDSVTRFLLASAARRPLVLLLDNLHAADRSSLAMLEYFGLQITDSPVLVVGTYRESEVDRLHPLRASINRLSRTRDFLRLELLGLSGREVAALLHSRLGQVPPASLVSSLLEQSGGNPLFVSEVAAMLERRQPDSQSTSAGVRFQVPQGLRDVISVRLDALPRDTSQLLRTAAVLGRAFEVSVLARVASLPTSKVMRLLNHAESAGVIELLAPDRFRFRHALFREVLYAEHNTVSRVKLHQRAGEELERRYADDPAPQLSRLAYHFFEAVQAGGEDKAIHYCREAAELAVLQRAYGEAATLLDCALQASELEQDPDPERRFELLLAMGRAEYQAGDLNAAAKTLMRAAIQAYRRERWKQLPEALWLFQLVCQQSGFHHVASVSLHKAALENLPAEEALLRARVLTSLALAYRTISEPGLAAESFRQGTALARECGDTKVLLDCLRKGIWTVGRSPGALREGLEIAREAFALATEQGNTAAALDSVVDTIFQLCDLGEIDELREQLDVLSQLTGTARQPHFRNMLVGFETALSILRGDWSDAAQKARQGMSQIPLQGVRGLRGRFAFQAFVIQKAQGGLDQYKDLADRIVADGGSSSQWLPGQVLLFCELGEFGQARKALHKLGDLRSLPADDLLQVALIYLAESCLKLGDRSRCQELYERLRPYRGLNVTLPGAFMLGAVSGYLAELAASLRRPEEARELFEEALTMNTRMGAAPALARTQVEFAHWLLRSDKERDHRKARQLIATARPAAASLGLAPVLRAIEDLEKSSDVESLTGREVDVLRTIAKGLSNKAIAETLNISHSTVTTHVRNIFRKISVANRTEAADFARRSGFVEPD